MSNQEERKQSLKLFIVLSRAYKVINEKVNEYIYETGLHPTEFAVLELLYHKGPQPLQQIGSKILLASGSITYVVDKLEKKQLLKRAACPTDRRVIHAEITEKGREFIDNVFPQHEESIHQLLSSLSEEEKETAIAIMRKLGLSIKDLS
ncbi:MarR family transcriptional regulator [Bacillus aerolatus]|uniref:MarR family transcriptional regulator n=1 Tax=Bacillus aerolatus TaxID=2653354 RepID=A0A6I1FXJ1_9BACI|nr:MarR family transcriptional regulator [Bacillus aerolatus]KAB7707878.1 MarR family transcriptional regulator [Bacillus aerolatus]